MPKMVTGSNNEGTKSRRVCLVSFPMPSILVVNLFITDLIEIFKPICESLYVVSSNFTYAKPFDRLRVIDLKTAMHFADSIHPKWWSTILQFFKIITIQVKMCWTLVKLSRKVEIVMFYVGGANIFLPAVVAKLLRKKIAVAAIGLGSMSYRNTFDNKLSGTVGWVYSVVFGIFERAIFSLADRIIVESKAAVDFLGLSRYEQKLISTGARYINPELFRIEKELKKRDNSIGYIGRLDTAKGVMQLIDAMPIVWQAQEGIKFLVGGDGPVYGRIQQWADGGEANGHNVELAGYVPHDQLPGRLNELKLLVLPSYSEGLPTIILEAMACGTPVLATSVGGVPDVIRDGETGFIMENNSPECIAQNILRVLDSPNLDRIVKSARKFIEEEYSYEQAVTRYEQILNEVMRR